MIHVKLSSIAGDMYYATRLSVLSVLLSIVKMYKEETATLKMQHAISGFPVRDEDTVICSVEYIKEYTRPHPHSMDRVIIHTIEGSDYYYVGDLVSSFGVKL